MSGLHHKIAYIFSRIPITLARNLYIFASYGVLKNKLIQILPSVILSPGNSSSNSKLINLLISAADIAARTEIEIPDRNLADSIHYNTFPGEHYRLLNGIVQVLKPRFIVEVGTYTGMGTVALMQGSPESKISTFDLVPYDLFSSHLQTKDFKNKRVTQILGDLSNEKTFQENFEILDRAELIFLDAPKDGKFEYKFLSQLTQLTPSTKRILIMDDIRFVNMVDLWNSIASPKIDAVSFGHFTGTGLCDISSGLILK
jgi:predicted O-methyltransferase YrrM